MSQLKILASHGSGNVAAILPDTVSSTRYVEFDAPYLKKALAARRAHVLAVHRPERAGQRRDRVLRRAGRHHQGREGPDHGPARLRVSAPRSSPTPSRTACRSIDYDRLTLGGSRKYYVSFNNVYVGTLLGKGLVSCIAAWNVQEPQVIVMHGDPTDNNATLFAHGYDAVLAPVLQARDLQGRGQPGRHLDADGRADRVPGRLHQEPEHQRRAHAERRERRADHPLPADRGTSSR